MSRDLESTLKSINKANTEQARRVALVSEDSESRSPNHVKSTTQRCQSQLQGHKLKNFFTDVVMDRSKQARSTCGGVES